FAALSDGSVTCTARWSPDGRSVPAPATDDHPFVYLRTSTIPAFYLYTLALILAAALVGVRVAGGPFRPMRPYLDLFFMGAPTRSSPGAASASAPPPPPSGRSCSARWSPACTRTPRS